MLFSSLRCNDWLIPRQGKHTFLILLENGRQHRGPQMVDVKVLEDFRLLELWHALYNLRPGHVHILFCECTCILSVSKSVGVGRLFIRQHSSMSHREVFVGHLLKIPPPTDDTGFVHPSEELLFLMLMSKNENLDLQLNSNSS